MKICERKNGTNYCKTTVSLIWITRGVGRHEFDRYSAIIFFFFFFNLAFPNNAVYTHSVLRYDNYLREDFYEPRTCNGRVWYSPSSALTDVIYRYILYKVMPAGTMRITFDAGWISPEIFGALT